FGLDEEGRLFWRGGRVGRLAAGESALTPRGEVRGGDFLEGEAKERVRQRLQAFARNEIERHLQPLFTAQALPLSGAARGRVDQLLEAAGCRPARRWAGGGRGGEGGRGGPGWAWAVGGCFSAPRACIWNGCCGGSRLGSARCCGRSGRGARSRLYPARGGRAGQSGAMRSCRPR